MSQLIFSRLNTHSGCVLTGLRNEYEEGSNERNQRKKRRRVASSRAENTHLPSRDTIPPIPHRRFHHSRDLQASSCPRFSRRELSREPIGRRWEAASPRLEGRRRRTILRTDQNNLSKAKKERKASRNAYSQSRVSESHEKDERRRSDGCSSSLAGCCMEEENGTRTKGENSAESARGCATKSTRDEK